MRMRTRQQGFLLLSAIIIIIAISFIAATAAYVFTTNARASSNEQLTTDAFYIAQAGLDVGMNRYMGNDTSQQLECTVISGTPALTNTAFGGGEFTVTATHFIPTPTALSAAISDSVTIIRINSAAGFAASGAATIGSEMVDYAGIGTTIGACNGTAPCLSGVTRGVAGTTAASHIVGTIVKQNFCQITSTAYVPSQASALASRTVKQDAIKASSAVWAGGDKTGGSGIIEQWTGSAWDQYMPGSVTDENMFGIFLNSEVDGWIVGSKTGSGDCGANYTSLFLKFDGSDWTRACAAGGTSVKEDLRGVHCATANFCMAVGKKRTFARWLGSGWTGSAPDTSGSDAVENVTYNSVFCNSSTDCWAVGDNPKNDPGAIAEWKGAQWKGYTGGGSIPEEDLNSVFCATDSDCWAVGDDEAFVYYNGSIWTDAAVTVSGGDGKIDIYGVTCVTGSDCWAVGKKKSGSGSYWRLNKNTLTWTRQTGSTVSGTANEHVFAVFCLESDKCYATGDKGTAAFWDGSSWSEISTGLLNVDMNTVHGVQSAVIVNRIFGWQEIIN